MGEPIPKEEIQRCMEKLSLFETEEIECYKEVYFLGLDSIKMTELDDVVGFYNVVPHDHIHYRYEILRPLNRGVFAEVVLAYDHKDQCEVAVKISTNTEENRLIFYEETHKLFVLNQYFDDEHTVKMFNYFIFRDHPCIVLEVLHNNLRMELRANKLKGFPVPIIKEIVTSILYGLQNLNDVELIHCDLKLDNILLIEKGRYNVKIIDFGCSVFLDEPHLSRPQCQSTSSPEMLLRLPFDLSSDIWNLGRVIVHLFLGKPYFTGETEQEEIARFAEVIGLPPQKLVRASKVSYLFFEPNGYPKYLTQGMTNKQIKQVLSGKINLPIFDLSDLLSKSGSPEFIDFVKQCLVWSPECRITPAEAFDHPWIKGEDKIADVKL